jgi:hypothetical protein
MNTLNDDRERREKQKLIYFKLDLLSIFFNKNYANNYSHPLDIHFFSLLLRLEKKKIHRLV